MAFAGKGGGSSAKVSIAAAWALYNFTDGPNYKSRRVAYASEKNCSFDNQRFISYSTCVGTVKHSETGEAYVLLSEHKYSPTTAQHLSAAATAAHEHIEWINVFWVPRVDPLARAGGDHEVNAKHLIADIADFEKKAIYNWNDEQGFYGDASNYVSASVYLEGEPNWRQNLQHRWNIAKKYLDLSGAPVFLPSAEIYANHIREARADRKHKYNHPTARAARERAAARRLAIRALELD